MADSSVRLARATDAPAVAAVQARAWRADYAALPAMTAGLDEAAMAASWREAVVSPPSAGHRVAVALSGAAVVGLAAWEPCDDVDAAPGEVRLALLVVDPAARGAGHGSRLLSAWADLAREQGATAGSTWVPAVDEAQRGFLESAGWAPDGAFRELALRDDDGNSDGDGDDATPARTLTLVRLVTSLR